MNSSSSIDTFYQVGGRLAANHVTYIKRDADIDLYNFLKNGEFCYVLTSRQSGKSSLASQIIYQLEQEEFLCILIDLQGTIDDSINKKQFYLGIIGELTRKFELDIDYKNWCKDDHDYSPVHRFSRFIEEVLLERTEQKICIFIDEIDVLLTMNSKVSKIDEFFSSIRSFYQKRADKEQYNRLTFCLLGVASPNDLIQDSSVSPFNIGRNIELTRLPFNNDAMSRLLLGLKKKVDNAEWILEQVWEWMGGQPFLTQKLCQLIVEKAESRNPNIDMMVREYFIKNWSSEVHFTTIKTRILKDNLQTK